MDRIYHIAQIVDWRTGLETGSYQAASLAEEGFIHCSNRDQVEATAGRYYAGRNDLVLLEIDTAKLDAELKYEMAAIGELYPHIYGALNLDAVVDAHEFSPQPDGSFKFPYS